MLRKLYIVASLNRITNLSIMLDDVGKNLSRVSSIVSLFHDSHLSSSFLTCICDGSLGVIHEAIVWP